MPGIALDEPAFVEIATEAADFILAELRTDDGRLLRSWKDGRAQHAGTLEDHAHLADGLLALYEATFEERFFIAARELADLVLEHFGADGRRLPRHRRRRRDASSPARATSRTTPCPRAAPWPRPCCSAWPRSPARVAIAAAAEAAMAPIVALAAKHPTGLRAVAAGLPARQRPHRRDRHRRRPRCRRHQGPARRSLERATDPTCAGALARPREHRQCHCCTSGPRSTARPPPTSVATSPASDPPPTRPSWPASLRRHRRRRLGPCIPTPFR